MKKGWMREGWMEGMDGKDGWKGWMERMDGRDGWKGWIGGMDEGKINGRMDER